MIKKTTVTKKTAANRNNGLLRSLILNRVIILSLLVLSSCSASSDEKDLGEEELLSTSQDLYSNGLYTTSRDNFTKFQANYPASSYATLAELKIADCDFYAGDYPKSITSYQSFLQAHPKSEAAEYAQLQIARAYKLQHNSTNTDQTPSIKAIENFEFLIRDYPEGVYAKQAVESIAEIREQLATHEIEVAEFYAKQKQFSAARHRLEIVMNQYPDTKIAFNRAPKLAEEFQLNIQRKQIKPIDKLEQIKNRRAVNTSDTIQQSLKLTITSQK